MPIKDSEFEVDIFSNKSSLILFWLLVQSQLASSEGFSVNRLAREVGLSVGLVHRIVRQLEYEGIIVSKGLRTKKKFFLKYPNRILVKWIKVYSLLKKTKNRGFSSPDSVKLSQLYALGLVPALHTAARELFGIKSTNLMSKEYYFLNWEKLPKLVSTLKLSELDRGYEFLIIKPYYSELLKKLTAKSPPSLWVQAYSVLVLLDLCHFPLRGVEQAETLFRKTEVLKSICQWSEIENVLGQ